MDNLAHTLIGAALGRAVADRRMPAAGLVGAVAGNAPDWTELLLHPGAWAPRAGTTYLTYHRGITHSLVGAALEIGALTGLLGLLLWWRGRGDPATRPPWRWIAWCVTVSVASHLYLDWQGSYGLRPFLPWSARWYYGDWVAIVDPFFWMVPLVALAWGAPRHWAPALGYALVLVSVSTLVLWGGRTAVAPWVRVGVVVLAVAGVAGWTQHWFGVAGRRRAAGLALLALAAYVALQAATSAVVQGRIRTAARQRFGPGATFAALTVVGHPFRWEPVWASPDSLAGPDWAVARHLDGPVVRRALATPRGEEIAQFARLLVADVDSTGDGVRVLLRDARFQRTARGRSWASVEIRVAPDSGLPAGGR